MPDLCSMPLADQFSAVFKSPVPNVHLWDHDSCQLLKKPDCFTNGGWWQEPRILAAAGEGAETEEPRAWKGWWNEDIVSFNSCSRSGNFLRY